jgi:medium-chain acyl-[acyl-carrier-protein] hydrolase
MSQARPTANRWVSPLPNDSRPAILCFPYGGGGASLYRGWSGFTPASIAICPVQLPGREDRFGEPLFLHMTELVTAAADAIAPLLRTPYAFFGHSLGGMIAYELTHELMRRGAPLPMHLFVSATVAPQLASTIAPIYQLPKEDFLREVQRYQGLPAEVVEHPELLDLLLPRLRADLTVTGTYQYVERPPLTIPITAFSGMADDIILPAAVEGWREQTVTTFRHESFPGGHFFIAEHARAIVSIVARALR